MRMFNWYILENSKKCSLPCEGPCNFLLCLAFHAQPELPHTCLYNFRDNQGNPRWGLAYRHLIPPLPLCATSFDIYVQFCCVRVPSFMLACASSAFSERELQDLGRFYWELQSSVGDGPCGHPGKSQPWSQVNAWVRIYKFCYTKSKKTGAYRI